MTMIVEPPAGCADKSCAVDRTSEACSSSSPPDLRESESAALTDVSHGDNNGMSLHSGTQRDINSSLDTFISAECFVLLTRIEADCPANVSPCWEAQSDGGIASSLQLSPGHGEEPQVESSGEGRPTQQEMQYACNLCKSWFKGESTLSDHHNFVHFKKAFAVCDFGEELTKLSYYSHNAKYKDHKSLKCCRCGMRFWQLKQLRQHMLAEGHVEEALFCCHKTFLSRGFFAAHLRRMHACEVLQDAQGNVRFLCKRCWQEFQTVDSVIDHQWQDHQAKPEAHGEGLPASECESDVNMPNGNAVVTSLFVCEHCGRSFGRKVSLLNHNLMNHGVQRSFRCQVCGAAFSRRHSYLAHLKKHRAETQRRLAGSPAPSRRPLRQVSCELCGGCFRTSMALKLHRQLLHSRGRRAVRGLPAGGRVRYSTGPPRLPAVPASRVRSKAWDDTSSRSSDCSAGGEEWRPESPSDAFFLSLSRPDCRFKCSLCPASFDLRVLLESHKRIHINKAYSCVECRMQFSDHVSRTVHFIQNH